MTPSDDLWIEMAQLDTHASGGVWEGAVPPEDAPPWYHEVAGLIRVARSPVQPDELAGEDAVVARMREAALEAAGAADDEPGRAGVDGRVGSPGVGAGVGRSDAGAAAGPGDERGRAGVGATAGAGGAETGRSGVDDGRGVTAGPPALTVVGTGPADADGSGGTEVVAELAPAGRGAKWAVRGESDDPRAAGRGGRVIGRIVAVKTVAATTALAVGITAAAATTGLVTVVVPAARERFDPKSPGQVVESEDGGSADTPAPGGRRSPRTSEACAGDVRCGAGGGMDGARGSATPDEGDEAVTGTAEDGSGAPETTIDDGATTGPDDELSSTTTTDGSSSTTGTSRPPSTSTTSSTTTPPDTTPPTTNGTVVPRSDPEDQAGGTTGSSAASGRPAARTMVQAMATSDSRPTAAGAVTGG